MNSKVVEIDRDYYLGLYRYTVQQYQPIIEKRSAVTLGEIRVKDVAELHADILQDLEHRASKGLIGPIAKLLLKWKLRGWADHAVGAISPFCSAFYYRQSLYIAFTSGMQSHDDYVIPLTTHELAHCLWEKLGGPPISDIRWRTERSFWKLKILGEGYAEYASKIGFSMLIRPRSRKVYCLNERMHREHRMNTQRDHSDDKLVEKYGTRIMLNAPVEMEEDLGGKCRFIC